MWKWLQSFLPTNTITGFIGSLGVDRNPDDSRDIYLSSFASIRVPKTKYLTDLSMIDVEDQLDKGTCVGQAEGGTVKFYLFKILGKIIPISHRSVYIFSKKYDGSPFQGTVPRIAALVITKYFGAATTDTVPDDNHLPYNQYMDVKLTGSVLDDAAKNKLPGFAFVGANEGEICTAIEDHGVVPASIAVDFQKWYTAFIARLFKIDGLHRIMLYGHELVGGRRKIYFRNSWSSLWGDFGNGWFWLDEYINNLYDLHVYTEIPKDLLEKARSASFAFVNDLELNDTGLEVYKMQQRLQQAGYLKGIDISSLEPSFGNLTAAALLNYQIDYHIDSAVTLKKLGGKYFGAKTRAFMNTHAWNPAKKNYIVMWGQAIQAFEGWYPGSRSYVNNNPGNLRSSPLQSSSNGGFAVFVNYEVGFKALTNLLQNAATGQSSVYNPNMTLLDFYNKYAPSNDGNYPANYAKFVATKMGVTPETRIGTFA